MTSCFDLMKFDLLTPTRHSSLPKLMIFLNCSLRPLPCLTSMLRTPRSYPLKKPTRFCWRVKSMKTGWREWSTEKLDISHRPMLLSLFPCPSNTFQSKADYSSIKMRTIIYIRLFVKGLTIELLLEVLF